MDNLYLTDSQNYCCTGYNFILFEISEITEFGPGWNLMLIQIFDVDINFNLDKQDGVYLTRVPAFDMSTQNSCMVVALIQPVTSSSICSFIKLVVDRDFIMPMAITALSHVWFVLYTKGRHWFTHQVYS